jgi:hypothetical protein
MGLAANRFARNALALARLVFGDDRFGGLYLSWSKRSRLIRSDFAFAECGQQSNAPSSSVALAAYGLQGNQSPRVSGDLRLGRLLLAGNRPPRVSGDLRLGRQ